MGIEDISILRNAESEDLTGKWIVDFYFGVLSSIS